MLVLVWSLMMMMSEGGAVGLSCTQRQSSEMCLSQADPISAHIGASVLLPFDQEAQTEQVEDVRWTHCHLMMSRTNNSSCHGGRCSLLKDGSLSFTKLTAADGGTYRLEAFNSEGTRVTCRDYQLVVEGGARGRTATTATTVTCLLLLLISIIIFMSLILRRERQTAKTTGQLEESVYVVMHGDRGNKSKEEGKGKPAREEENIYVPCQPVVSIETPITQPSMDEENVYM